MEVPPDPGEPPGDGADELGAGEGLGRAKEGGGLDAGGVGDGEGREKPEPEGADAGREKDEPGEANEDVP